MSVGFKPKPHDHVVHFYQDDASLMETVADYFRTGDDVGDRLVALLTPPHRGALLQQLKAVGVDTRNLLAEGRLVIMDARSILDRIMRDGVPVYSLFQQHVLALIVTSAPQPIRAFGELVNLLCADGNPSAAIQVEDFWHKACERLPLTLLCGYDLYAFHQDGGQHAFRTICGQHSHVLSAEISSPTGGKSPTPGISPVLTQRVGSYPQTGSSVQDRHAQATCNEILAQLTAPSSAERDAMRSDVTKALSRGELIRHFRPMVCARTRQVRGVSILPYWHSPRFGILAPNRWMEAAMEGGQSAAISRWLLTGACQHAMGWYVVPGSGLRMTVPISANDLIDIDLIARVDEALSASGLPGDMLELEVSDDALAGAPRQTEAAVKRLKALGVRLSLAGVSSSSSILQHFSRYPMDTLRLSGTIVNECLDNRHHQATLKSMIEIAHQLGLAVTAGNVSTREQASYLLELGCDTLQGELWASLEYCESESTVESRATGGAPGFSGTENAETDWKDGRDLLGAIMNTTLDGLGVLEAIRNESGTITDFHIRKYNYRMGEIVGGLADNLIGKRLLDTHPGTKEENIFQAYCDVVESGTPMQMETHYQHKNLDLSARITAVRMEDGVLVTITDISAFKQREQRLLQKRRTAERAALHDSLTGLPNRSYLERKLGALANTARRDWYALVFIDLDNFKILNDTHGHQVGDRALEAVASALNTHLRIDDFVARVGGDEFVVVLRLESADEPQANELVRRVIEAVRSALPVPVGASFGLHIWQATVEDSHEALFKADRTMYEYKLRRRASD